MAPTSSPIIVHSPNHPSGRHLHRLRHHPHHPSRPLLDPRGTQQPKARNPDAAPQPSVVSEGPPPPSSVPVPTPPQSAAFGPGPSHQSQVSTPSSQPEESNQSVDLTGNVLAAVVVVVLILGGLVGLVVGGERLRRRARARSKSGYPPRSRCLGRRKSAPVKSSAGFPQQHAQSSHERFAYQEKTLTPLTRPVPVLDRERHRGLTDVWPVRSLSMVMNDSRSCPVQAECSVQQSALPAIPQTTWSDFYPVPLYVPSPRTVLDCIPEELEESQGNSDPEIMLGVTFASEASTPQTNGAKSSRDTLLDGPESAMAEQRAETCKATASEETGSLESSAPDMTSDEGESSRSSTASLESLEAGNESLGEEVFELRRVQTRSMQINKGVLLSLGSKTLGDGQSSESTHEECGASRRPSSVADEGGGKVRGESGLSVAMFGENFSAVDLDDFPSLPSILPMIPSFISGF